MRVLQMFSLCEPERYYSGPAGMKILPLCAVVRLKGFRAFIRDVVLGERRRDATWIAWKPGFNDVSTAKTPGKDEERPTFSLYDDFRYQMRAY